MGRERRDLSDLRASLNRRGHVSDRVSHRYDAALDAALESHGVGPCGDVLESLVYDRLRENRGRGRAVARHVVGLARGLFQKLGAHILERVLKLDLLGDRDAVGAYLGWAEFLVEHHVSSAWAEGYADGVGHDVNTALHRGSCFFAELKLFRHTGSDLLKSPIAWGYFLKRMSSSRRTRYSTSPSLYSVPAYFE